jgi:hypothetical protein
MARLAVALIEDRPHAFSGWNRRGVENPTNLKEFKFRGAQTWEWIASAWLQGKFFTLGAWGEHAYGKRGDTSKRGSERGVHQWSLVFVFFEQPVTVCA